MRCDEPFKMGECSPEPGELNTIYISGINQGTQTADIALESSPSGGGIPGITHHEVS